LLRTVLIPCALVFGGAGCPVGTAGGRGSSPASGLVVLPVVVTISGIGSWPTCPLRRFAGKQRPAAARRALHAEDTPVTVGLVIATASMRPKLWT
jgi:hypothetical protein